MTQGVRKYYIKFECGRTEYITSYKLGRILLDKMREYSASSLFGEALFIAVIFVAEVLEELDNISSSEENPIPKETIDVILSGVRSSSELIDLTNFIKNKGPSATIDDFRARKQNQDSPEQFRVGKFLEESDIISDIDKVERSCDVLYNEMKELLIKLNESCNNEQSEQSVQPKASENVLGAVSTCEVSKVKDDQCKSAGNVILGLGDDL